MAPLQNYSTCTLPRDFPINDIAIVPHTIAKDEFQTLILSKTSLCRLLGADAHSSFAVGGELELHAASQGLDLTSGGGNFADPVWDSWSGALYFFYGRAVLRLVGDQVTQVAGDVGERGEADGVGPAARLKPRQLVSDGAGSLYCCDEDTRHIRRIQLPAAWRSAAPMCDGAGAAPHQSASEPTAAAMAAAAADAAPAVVSTLPYQAPSGLWGIVFLPPATYEQPSREAGGQQATSSSAGSSGAGWLVFGTATAFYRLPLPILEPAAPPLLAAASGGAAAGAAQQPAPLQAQLLVGAEGNKGYTDGPGDRARFTRYEGLTSDAAGNIYLSDGYAGDNEDGSRVRRVSPDGVVTTLVTGLPGDEWWSPAILPNGYLALGGGWVTNQLLLIDLGLTPVLPQRCPAAAAGASAAGPPPRSLPADLGALLDAQPDGTADLAIRVGERRFHVHRAILSARSDYFKQRLAADGGFADAAAAELELPDADADAFALLLRWLYTGGADVPSDQARGVAELADRLLLPELCAAALEVVAASVTAGSVVDCLLWAWGCCESRGGGGGFGGLLGQLKAWYVSHHEEVRREAGPSRQRLAAAPALMEEMVDMLVEWERDRKLQSK